MIHLSRLALVRALDALAPVVAGAGKDSRFSHVLVESTFENGSITAISNDYSLVGVRDLAFALPAGGEPASFSAMIPHAWLSKVAKESAGDVLTLAHKGGQYVATAGRTRFTQAEYTDDFVLPEPLADEAWRCDFTGKELADALAEVSYALPKPEAYSSRPGIVGVLVESDEQDLRFVATSGYQLAMSVQVWDAVDAPDALPVPPWRLTIPPPAVPVLRGFFAPSERVRLLYAAKEGAAYATFAGEWGSLRVRLPDAEYPPYRSFVDLPNGDTVTAARADLLAAASRAMLNGDQPLTLRWTGRELEARADGYEDALPADCDGEFRFRGTAAYFKAAVERTKGESVRLVRRGRGFLFVFGDGMGMHATARLLNEDEK